MAGKMLNFDDPRSKLFFEYVRLVNAIKPKYFLLENVKMKKDFRDKISEIMGCEPILIDSALVSAQHRERYYRTNIPGVVKPEDKNIVLKDIIIQEPVEEKYYLTESQIKTVQRNFGAKWKILNESASLIEKLTFPSRINQIDWLDIKCPTLCSAMWTWWGNVPCIIYKNNIRKLTPIECERLQTLPDNYTEWISNTQRYKALWNWWTVDVIAHIFSFINKQQWQN